MPLLSSHDFLVALRASSLLPTEVVDGLAKAAAGDSERDSSIWADELVARGLLTAYQARELLSGRGQALVLGRYRLLDRLAVGGMGHVYKAEHILMKRIVALKVIAGPEGVVLGASGDSPVEARATFQREIQAAAQLCHPNIVTAFDAAEADGVHFLVMEYVDGIDLERLVRQAGPLPTQLACEYVRQAAVGLQYAYERGLLHCDIKPANLLVTTASTSHDTAAPAVTTVVKLLDLGLAWPTAQARGEPNGDADLSGTPDYLAPEVGHDCRSRDIRSDLYSLGCTFYYLLSGRVLFPGGTWTEKLLRHQYETPPLAALGPEVPPVVKAIIGRLLAKDPADRYATPAQLTAALGEWLTQAGPVVEPRPQPLTCVNQLTPPALLLPAPTKQDAPTPRRPHAENAPPSVSPCRRVWAPGHLGSPRPQLSWMLAIAMGAVIGLLVAWMVRQSHLMASDREEAAAPARAGSACLPPVLLERTGTRYGSLAEAVAAAADGDTLTVQVDGPLPLEPLAIQGKALVLRAAPGSYPCLTMTRPPPKWEALLSTDRSLTLEGLEFRCPLAGEDIAAPLLCSQGAALRLLGCRLCVPGWSGVVVCRGCPRVELRGCEVRAASLALCLEAGDTGCTAVLADNHIEVQKAGAAAVSVWRPEMSPATAVHLDLDHNDIQAARPLALRDLSAGVTVSARGNHFTFHEALLSLTGFGGQSAWRRALTWHDSSNRYSASGEWLQVDGVGAGVQGLDSWETLWRLR